MQAKTITPCGERGSALLVSLLVMLLMFVLGISLLTMSVAEATIAQNDVASESAFYAAESAVQTGLAQIGANTTTSIAAIPVTTLTNGASFRSGRATDTSAQPLTFLGSSLVSGYTLGNGSGYGGGGFVKQTYQINATGSGPRNSVREVEVRVEYGPVPR